MKDVARINKQTGLVVNIERADDAWIADNSADETYLFIPYTTDNPACIGMAWDEVTGFQQPVTPAG